MATRKKKNNLETIVNTHESEMQNLQKIIDKHLVETDIIIHEWNSNISETHDEIKELSNKVGDIAKIATVDVKNLHDKVDRILNIKVNGSANLEESLREVYRATKSQRSFIRIKDYFKGFFARHTTIKAIFTSGLMINLYIIAITWIVLSTLHIFDVHIGVEETMKKLFQFMGLIKG